MLHILLAAMLAKPARKSLIPPATTPTRARADAPRGAADRPPVDTVALTAPARTGRSIQNLSRTLERAEVRLRIAWSHRAELDPALPGGAAYHARAWSALDLLRAQPEAATNASTEPTLVQLVGDLTTLRTAVMYTTRPGDAARETLRMATPLNATASVLDVAPEIVAGARTLQERFPALTDAAIAAAERSFVAAQDVVRNARNERVVGAVRRVATADERQLAVDVLLDCVDHLRAAARTTLHATRPGVCKTLCAAIEPNRRGAKKRGAPHDGGHDGGAAPA